ncbi:hypothetical protein BJF79_12290 [Actinomadura sp. CNU-125]|nr:hypothetical protein BJF79_12290 [Actinomadura sp. CNU-125]
MSPEAWSLPKSASCPSSSERSSGTSPAGVSVTPPFGGSFRTRPPSVRSGSSSSPHSTTGSGSPPDASSGATVRPAAEVRAFARIAAPESASRGMRSRAWARSARPGSRPAASRRSRRSTSVMGAMWPPPSVGAASSTGVRPTLSTMSRLRQMRNRRSAGPSTFVPRVLSQHSSAGAAVKGMTSIWAARFAQP